MPQPTVYRLDQSNVGSVLPSSKTAWLKAWPEDGSTNFVELGDRVVLQLKTPGDLKGLIAGHPLNLSRTISSNVFILQAPDCLTAAREAHRLAAVDEVVT